MSTLDERIKLLRTKTGLTQVEFGRKVRLSGASVSTAEAGKTTPDNQTLQLIADKFGVSYDWLKHGTGDMYTVDDANSPEALVPDLVDILAGHPALLHVMQTAVQHMRPGDWDRLNEIVDECSKKEQT